MLNLKSQEECARYILLVLKKLKARAGYVLFNPNSIPEFDQLLRGPDFKRGVEYALDKKWLIKERSMWRLTMRGFAEILYDNGNFHEAVEEYLAAQTKYLMAADVCEKSVHRPAVLRSHGEVQRIFAKWRNDANEMLDRLFASRRKRL